MARRIEEFLSKGARPDRVRQFERLSEGLPKGQLRDLEMEMLEPEPIPGYVGEEIRYIANSEFSARFVFKDQEEMDFFARHVPIAVYQERSITNIKIIMDLFRAIEGGEVTYDKKSGKFTFVGKAAEPKESIPEPEPTPTKEPESNVSPGRKLLRRAG